MSSSPAADARLFKAPSEVRIAFSEPADPGGSQIQVLDTAGSRYDKGDLAPSGAPNELRISVGPIPEGGYVVSWTALSTVDGHQTRGAFAFVVGDAPLPALPDIPDASPPPGAVEILGRALGFGGVALALGIVLFGALVRQPRTEGERKREARALALGGTLLVVGTALLALDQGGRLPPRLGLLLAMRALAGLVIASLQLGPALRLPALGRRLVTYAAGSAAALSLTLVSHAAASGSLGAVLLDLVHVYAVSSWLGGIAGLLWIVLPSARTEDEASARALGATVRRFSLLAMASVATLVLTGIIASLDRLVLVEDLWETPYGIALAAKLALLAIALAAAALNLFVAGPRLRRGISGPGTRLALVRASSLESGVLALVLLAAGALTSLPPPASADGASFDETVHASGLRLELLVPTTLPGRNRFVLRVHEGLAPVAGAEKVALRFTLVEHDMGESELVAAERQPGEYVAEGSPTTMFGTWNVEAIVRRTGRQDVRAVFRVPIAPAGQTAASARALPLGSYTLVTFLEPAPAAAGAPLSLSVVLVDSNGSPVPGRMLRVSFEGPGTVAPIDATEQAGGRYVFPIQGLEAGTWSATIALGTDGTVKYEFEVQR